MKKAFVNGIILDGTRKMEPIYHQVVVCEEDRIVEIAENVDLSDCEVIDLKGKYLMPGLINLHIHLPASGKPKKKPSDPKKLVKLVSMNKITKKIALEICAKSAKTQLLSGVTTVRTVGGIMDVDTRIRDSILSGKRLGPRILASNMAISVPHGHMAGSLAYAAKTPQEASDDVLKIASDDVDLIKLMITGGVLDARVKGEPGELKMEAELVKAACLKAHELGLKVAAHVESPLGVEVALENGVDTIEHGAKPTSKIMELFKERKACLVTTLSPALPFALFDPNVSYASDIEQYNGNIVFEGIIECAKACMKENILVGLGTDTGCPYVTHYDMWRELVYFKKYCGVSNAYALHTATQVNAQILGLDDVGTIKVGKCADMIVTERNPLDDLCALRDVSLVIARGKVITNLKVRKMKNVERELDKFL